ncbi:MAG: phytanoyl-CoA dioxygenase family protein [Pseudomonadales bacterium]|nr:phytanoyl-CoA dioxygenase family protein [Pseudomonadales bacterium]
MAEKFAERVVSFERPGQFHTLLIGADGRFLGIGDDGEPTCFTDADDKVIWDQRNGEVQHTTTGRSLTIDDGAIEVDGEGFAVSHGPEKLPSEYLGFFEDNGWVCLTSVLSDEVVDGLRRVACTDQYAERDPDRARAAISQHVAVAQTAAEPISLWLIRQYMQIRDIAMAHTPAMAVLTKDDGKRPVQGWHSDYPYHWGVPAPGQVPVQPGASRLGVQRNVCVSDFTKVGGATAFKLGSHARNEGPPDDWGTAARYASRSYRAEHGLPYNGPDADIVEAPGGSIILYDSRTWHRAGVNRTDNKRAAMLQAMVPMYVMPKVDMSAAYKQFAASPVYQDITERERVELEALLVRRLPGPPLHGALGTDPELVALVQKGDGTRTGY